jgi:hypothetical protein
MAVFSKSEIADYNRIMESEQRRANEGKPPQVSSILMSLQVGVTLPLNEDGLMWFNDDGVRNLLVASAKKLMSMHNPDEFSVIEKAFLFSMLQTAWLYETTSPVESDDPEGGESFIHDFDAEMGGEDND